MKAVTIHAHGDPDVLKIDQVPRPIPQSGEVLVRIQAAALNHLDLWVRKGIPGISLPIIPGSEAAGTIEEMAADVQKEDRFQIGDHVITLPFRSCTNCAYCVSGREELCAQYVIPGEHMDGVMAECVSIPVKFIRKKPDNIDFVRAAAYQLVFMTAYHMLNSKVKINQNDWVFVWGASSGVGHAAIQIAKQMGARVIATAGNLKKEKFANDMGSDFVIDYKRSDVLKQVRDITSGHGADIVFEHVGQRSWPDSIKMLARGGRLVTCGATTGALVNIDLNHLFIKHQQIIGSTMGNINDIDAVTKLIEADLITPHVDKIFPLEKIIAAHKYLEEGKQAGKVVISL